MDIIEIEELNFGYSGEYVLKNLNMKIERGEFAVIQGNNGSGKSTLLKLILGELKRDSGSIRVLGHEIENLNSFSDIGYVPQVNSVNKISFPVTCIELVALGLYDEFGFIKIPRKRHLKRAEEAIKSMGMDEYIRTPFNEMSGGQQQRVMIARAIVKNPEIIILDEPTVGVDQISKESFIELISDMNKTGVTIVMVTHEMDSVKDYYTKLYKLENGVMLDASI